MDLFVVPYNEEGRGSKCILSLSKGCEIEVLSMFKGAWYRAILEDVPSISGKKKLRVRHLSLLGDDGSPLRETTRRRFIRPVPPEKMFSSVDFVKGSVVEASRKDGWWTGVVVKITEDDKHLVYLDSSPPDLIQFERRHLRQHFNWSKERPRNKVARCLIIHSLSCLCSFLSNFNIFFGTEV